MTVIDWLLDGDASIRWQVIRDLTREAPRAVARERGRVSTEGVGARLLALQADDGRWGGAAWNRGWNSTMHSLMLLRDLGLDPASGPAHRAVGLVRERVTWRGCGPRECEDNAFFAGEVEPCINGQVAAVGAYFGRTSGASSTGCSESSCQTAAGTAKHQIARLGRRSIPPSACWKPCSSTNGRAQAAGRRPRPVCVGRSTCSRGGSCVGGRRARRSSAIGRATVRGSASPSRHGGTTTYCAGLTTCAAPASRRTSVWPRPSSSSRPSAAPTDEGEGRPSRWNTLRALRVLGWYERARS